MPDLLDQRLDAVFEEMIGARNHRVLDLDALLRLELLDEAGDFLQGRDAVLVAMHEQAGGRAGREEGEIEAVGGRRDRDEAFDLRPAHQKLHADPGAEGDAGDPAGARLRIDRLRPVERGGGVRQFALAMVEAALAAPDAAEIEAQHGEAALGEGVIEIVDDLIIHRPAELRVRVQDDGDRRAAHRRGMKTALDAAGRTIEHDFGHLYSILSRRIQNARATPLAAALTCETGAS